MKKIIRTLGIISVLALSPSASLAAGNVMVTSVVKDFVLTGGNIGCPKGPWGNAFAVDVDRLMGKMDERSMEQLINLIGQFESKNGVEVRSNTNVRNFQTVSDTIRTKTTGPAEGVGAQLCNLAGAFV